MGKNSSFEFLFQTRQCNEYRAAYRYVLAACGFRAGHLERSSVSQQKGLQAHTEETSVTQELAGLPAGLENTAAKLT